MAPTSKRDKRRYQSASPWPAVSRLSCMIAWSRTSNQCQDLENKRGQKINANFFVQRFRQPFRSWTSAPKIVDVRTKKCVFLRPAGGEKLFDPWASGRKGQERLWEIRTKKFMFMLFFFPATRESINKTRTQLEIPILATNPLRPFLSNMQGLQLSQVVKTIKTWSSTTRVYWTFVAGAPGIFPRVWGQFLTCNWRSGSAQLGNLFERGGVAESRFGGQSRHPNLTL